jgi:hypothetical protein
MATSRQSRFLAFASWLTASSPAISSTSAQGVGVVYRIDDRRPTERFHSEARLLRAVVWPN